ncbi:hypothetical protein ITP53_06855 [Nonomuraea sp. K274]|uniref:ATPase dynein-related AAA domain-containing protein n=1 Tax=Nonomuraea cypriaca TaxID=1187855 RepID=A0A931A9U7_9ACTN|nr:AAA family ATPase [Nonomuraea cypriaca]MBF8185462.1 hypothetical protein [Nonomuraea cypriaca]
MTEVVQPTDRIDEQARKTIVILHSLTDHRRMPPMERLGASLAAHTDFLLVASYNPGYQAVGTRLEPPHYAPSPIPSGSST